MSPLSGRTVFNSKAQPFGTTDIQLLSLPLSTHFRSRDKAVVGFLYSDQRLIVNRLLFLSSGIWRENVGHAKLARPPSAHERMIFRDIRAQWAKIRQGLDIFRISSKCVCLSNGEV